MRLPIISVCFGLLLLPSADVSAKTHKKHRDDPQRSRDAADWVPPAEWNAGARINAFLQTSLENSILAPLDSPAPSPRSALSALGIDFASRLAAAESAEERALFSSAAGICELLTRILDEREQGQIGLLGLRTTGKAASALDRAELQARLKSLDKRNFFVASKLRQWAERTAALRGVMQNAAVAVNTAQIRLDRARTAAENPKTPVSDLPPAEVVKP